MTDPFEESLRRMLRDDLQPGDDDGRLGRVLRTAKRQVGIGELFMLPGHWFEALLTGLSAGGPRRMAVTRRLSPSRSRTSGGEQ